MNKFKKNIVKAMIATTCTFSVASGSIVMIPAAQAAAETLAWQAVGDTGFSVSQVYNVKLLVGKDGTLYVGFQDMVDGKYVAVVKKYTTEGWKTVGSPVPANGSVSAVSFTLDKDDTPYVSYKEGGNNKATVMKYKNGSWQAVGTPGFTPSYVNSTAIAVDQSGTPYVALRDGLYGDKATVMKYVNGSWQVVGTPGFSAGLANDMSLKFDQNGIPYVAYADKGNADKLTVMKYTNGRWQAVGTPGFSAGEANGHSLTLDEQGTPYVAYNEYLNGKYTGAKVMKYVDGSWQLVGEGPISSYSASGISIALNKEGVPYITYADGANSLKAVVKKYTNGQWQTVGTSGFSAGQANGTSLALDGGAVYVAYADQTNGGKATVMKLLEQQPSTPPLATDITILNNPAGVTDKVTVSGLSQGDVVNVYRSETDGTAIGYSQPVESGQTTATVNIEQLGSSDGTIYVSVKSAGKTESPRTAVTYGAEDALPPETTITVDPAAPSGNNGWYNTSLTVNLNAIDHTNGSGVAKTEYRINGEEAWSTYDGSFELSKDGQYKIEYRSTDNAGNVESTKTLELKLDSTAPVTKASVEENANDNNWYNKDVHVTLSAEDNLAGIEKTEYSLDSGKTWDVYNGVIAVSTDGKHTVKYRSIDSAGNVEKEKSVEVNIDQTAPTFEVILDKNTLWSPNHKMVKINATIRPGEEVSGLETIVLTSITSNEVLQPNDIQNAAYNVPLKNFTDSFELRAERNGNEDKNKSGRIYTITYTATDKAGNVAVQTATVTVPHDQSEKTKN
ncbi:OmpL47-type beta-barrel domain-containing protein [Bacillus sp. OTU530]|uniref:OmpL47-type beta-barrel domain-containing protein n=1 Tax=Bacillus sp. OTU530 TaxID=3043862 RepID=UPI00313C9C53